jgi:signal peptidase I
MRNFLLMSGLTLLGVLLCLGALGVVLVSSYQVNGVAMEPTLHAGERLATIRLVIKRTVNRGEVVEFYAPYDPRVMAIGRVVGLPGDHIRVASGTLFLNGKQIYEPYIMASPDRVVADFPSSGSSIFDDGELRRLQNVMYAEWVTNGELVVPDGYYFVLGDNRNKSMDSRNYGPVVQNSVFARPVIVYSSNPSREKWRPIDSYLIGN